MKHKNWKNKLLSALMAAVMTLSLLPATALAVTVDDTYVPGTYTGTAQGLKGSVSVSLTLSDGGTISDITAASESETPDFWAKAVNILDIIKGQNGTDGLIEKLENKEIDTVTGATYSAKGIVLATEDALSKASSAILGSGTESDPYRISSEAGLRYLQAQVAAGSTYAGQYLKLTSDIALTGEWTPIGSSGTLAFGGTFDGDGHSISGMTITDSTLGYVGLFGYTLNGVVIQNVHLTDVSINISDAAQNVYAGALVAFIKNDTSGTASSIIDGCTVSGSISITTANKVTVVGGLTGFTDQRAAITNCGTDVTVTADSGTGRATVGGLSAWASIRALFMNNYALGDVSVTTTCTNYGNVGGAFGQVNGIVYNVYTAGNVTLTSPETVTYKPGAIAGDLAAATYADSCYYVGDTAFGAGNGKFNAETVGKKTADEAASEEFAQLLHDNLAPAAIAVMTENVTATGISGCGDFAAMTARVNDAFQDWTLSDGQVVLSGSLWTSGEIDASIFESGDGSEENPYLITNETQLRNFAASMNEKIDYTGKFVALSDDIDVSSAAWTPIGGSDYAFNGSFDGRGHAISGITLGSQESPLTLDKDNIYIGLFGVLGSSAYVKNVSVQNAAIYTHYALNAFLGGIAGYTDGSRVNGDYRGAVIDNCSVTGEITSLTSESFSRAGGLAASVLRGAVTNSWADVDITAETDTNNVYAGGFYGMDNRVTTVNCYVLGNVTGNSTNNNKVHIGGFVGQAGGIHVNCYAAGDVVSRKTTTDVGIFSGRSSGINIDYHCYYNTEAALQQGDTVISPAAAVGVVTTNATEVDVTGKTAEELKGSDFAALLNSNRSESAMAAAMAEINALLAAPGSSLSQANYYAGTALLAWTAKGGAVTFGTDTQPGGNGGNGGSSSSAVTPAQPENPFTDVAEGSPYQDAILWALEKGITTGTTATTFSPNAPCTRGQAVTFLWRAAGSPEPKRADLPFTDVAADSVYAKAILWAVEQGITLGTTENSFSPNAPCTRGQIVTFLYRAAGSPAVDGAANPFTDVSADSPFLNAILWAAQEGITTGTTENTSSPGSTCTRGQIVTFLYRSAD